jgi:hypothetical protein
MVILSRVKLSELIGISKGEAFRTLDWEWQERMMDALNTGLDRALVGFK